MEDFVEEDFVEEGAFDQSTLKALYKLSNKGEFTAIGGALSTGKEADVFYADKGEDRGVAIKVYRTATSAFKTMREALRSDPRVKSLGKSSRAVVYRWTQREYGNLQRASEYVRVPEPLAKEKNVLIMEFIGEDEMRAPSMLEMEFEDRDDAADRCVRILSDLYDGGMVHGDFSEYNVLVMGELVLIDFSQAVTKQHPMADELLQRDVGNLVRFFSDKGVSMDESEVMDRVVEAS